MFPGEKMSPAKAMTMKDYENQITALKKENFNLKLRIYFLEERVQQKCDDSTEDIYKTNIELKVEVESMKRELAEKQELLVSASKALESLASRDSGEGFRERAQREKDALKEAFNTKIRELEESLRCAEEEVEKMAFIAEQEKLRSLGLEKELQAASQSGPSCGPDSNPRQIQEFQQALEIERLQDSVKKQDTLIGELQQKSPDKPVVEQMVQLNNLIGQKDGELQALKEELDRERGKAEKENQVSNGEVNRLQQMTRQLTEELKSTKNSSQTLKQRLEEMERENKTLSVQLEERDSELAAEKRNSLKRDKTIQGLSLLLKEKEKEVEELYGNLEEKDQVLAKAREALHKAQLQKYQGAEEQQALLLSQQAELSRLQAEAHSSLLEAQRLQRLLSSRDAELALLQQDKLQLEQELELLQQQKRKADKTINDLQNQLKKLRGELADRENSLEHQQLEQQERTRATENKLQTTIQHLTTSLTHKEQQLQDYMNMVQDLEQDRAPGGSDAMLVKLRERLREKEKALEKALDEKYAAVEEKENEIHLLQLNVREKERDLERLNNLLTHNEETINSFDALLKEKDVELQQLLNSLKNVQRSKQENSIIQHLQHTLELKTKDMEEMASTVLSQSESQGRDLIEQMNQRIKLTEVMLTEAVKDRERLVCENQTAVENLLATINSKDQLLKECAERHAQALSEWTAELQNLRSQLTDAQLQLSSAQKLNSMATQDTSLETAQLRAALAEKDAVINKLLERGQERDRYMAEVKVGETPPPQVLELRQTIEVLQERLEEREAELSRRNSEENLEKSLPGSKKSAVILKKELAQKTDALNSALKRENQLKMSLAELQSVVSELEGQLEGQKANIESLASTLNTKEEIIAELQQRLVQRGENRLAAARDHLLQPGEEHSFPSLPQRERTLIGGDSQQEAMPSVVDLRLEQAELNRILRAEQQLYSNLVRAVKEQDSAQRLQALQLELAALTLLRQQLEDGIRCNEELREHLHREIQRASQREGADPAELESMRDALEEAHRWNASLQARLGQIQSRGGGVGQANDSVDTLSLIGEQTSYMSICVGEALDEELSVEQLRLKMSELQALNAELQRKLATTERGVVGNVKGASDLIDLSSPSKVTHDDLQVVARSSNDFFAFL
uniref:CDK5 regulatory subunit associated protein 2 n=1 Tax=Pygocentrus nattereri TaxID=42514 RepID=A0A3B4DP35_PYGNA